MKPTTICLTELIPRFIIMTVALFPPAFIPLSVLADGPMETFTPQERSHWAFQKVTPPKPPKVVQTDWVGNPIDAFILAELEAKGLKPAPPAAKCTWLRRASFDLTGLPPSPEEGGSLLSDESTRACDRV